MDVIKKISLILSKDDKKFFFYLLVFSLFISLMETIGVSIIMPFISLASNFSLVETNKYYNFVFNLFQFKNPISFVISFGILLILFYIFRSLINLFYFYLLSKFSKGRFHVIAMRIFQKYLDMKYIDFIDRNSSELSKAIVIEAQNVTSMISSILFMISEIFIIILIYCLMLYFNWEITIYLTLFLFVNGIFLTKYVSPKIKNAGKNREEFQRKFYEILTSSFGNFKILKLKAENDEIINKFSHNSSGFTKMSIFSDTMNHLPRLYLEGLSFSIIAMIIIYLVYTFQTDISSAFAMISLFVLGLYRLMPSVNRIISGYYNILYNLKSLDIVYSDILQEGEELKNKKIDFKEKIDLQDICFGYIKDKPVIKNLNLEIYKGTSIAFVGESGSGKSTLVDIIIGLYEPENGKINVDNDELMKENKVSWRKKIGYIPQNVYLFEGSVAENIALSSDIDEDRVREVLKKANILDFLEQKQNGINTLVGEAGIKLSGGQKQRIAIARALYNDPDILILDEATSALDTKTEEKIMEEIYAVAEGKTLIIIAHRLSTIEKCEHVYKIENGKLHNVK